MIVDEPGGHKYAHGYYDKETNTIFISKKNALQLEKASAADKQAALLGVYATILHETAHYGDELDGMGSDSYHPGVQLISELFPTFSDSEVLISIHNIEDAKKVINDLNKNGRGYLLPTVPTSKQQSSSSGVSWNQTATMIASWMSINPNIQLKIM